MAQNRKKKNILNIIASTILRTLLKVAIWLLAAMCAYVAYSLANMVDTSDNHISKATINSIFVFVVVLVVVDLMFVETLNVIAALTLVAMLVPAVLYGLSYAFKVEMFFGPITTAVTNAYQFVLLVVCHIGMYFQEKIAHMRVFLMPIFGTLENLQDTSLATENDLKKITDENQKILGQIHLEATGKSMTRGQMNSPSFPEDMVGWMKSYFVKMCMQNAKKMGNAMCAEMVGPRGLTMMGPIMINCYKYFQYSIVCVGGLDILGPKFSCLQAYNLCGHVARTVCNPLADSGKYCRSDVEGENMNPSERMPLDNGTGIIQNQMLTLNSVKDAASFKDYLPATEQLVMNLLDIFGQLKVDFLGTVMAIIGTYLAVRFIWCMAYSLASSLLFYLRYKWDIRFANYTLSSTWAKENNADYADQLVPLRVKEARFKKVNYLVTSIVNKAIENPTQFFSYLSLAYALISTSALNYVLQATLEYSKEAFSYQIPVYAQFMVAFHVQGTSTLANMLRPVLAAISFDASTYKIINSASCDRDIKYTELSIKIKLCLLASSFFVISCLQDQQDFFRVMVCEHLDPDYKDKRNRYLADFIMRAREMKKARRNAMVRYTEGFSKDVDKIVQYYRSFSVCTPGVVRRQLTAFKFQLTGFNCLLCFQDFCTKNRPVFCHCYLLCQECADDVEDYEGFCIACHQPFKFV